MARTPMDPIAFSVTHLPGYDRHLLQLLDRVTTAVEKSEKVDVAAIVWDYSWYFSSIRNKGTREASAYVQAAQELWEAVGDTYRGEELDKPPEELVREFTRARHAVYEILLPHHDVANPGLEEAVARFLRISAPSARPSP